MPVEEEPEKTGHTVREPTGEQAGHKRKEIIELRYTDER
jgi:hypothetical protein